MKRLLCMIITVMMVAVNPMSSMVSYGDDGAANKTVQAAASETAATDVVTPEAVAPQEATPEAITPQAVAPAATTPAATTPEAVAPEVVTPQAVTPQAVTPGGVGEPTSPKDQKNIEASAETEATSQGTVNKDDLNRLISISDTSWQFAPSNCTQQAKDTLKTAINAASSVAGSSTATQADVDAANTALDKALNVFMNSYSYLVSNFPHIKVTPNMGMDVALSVSGKGYFAASTTKDDIQLGGSLAGLTVTAASANSVGLVLTVHITGKLTTTGTGTITVSGAKINGRDLVASIEVIDLGELSSKIQEANGYLSNGFISCTPAVKTALSNAVQAADQELQNVAQPQAAIAQASIDQATNALQQAIKTFIATVTDLRSTPSTATANASFDRTFVLGINGIGDFDPQLSVSDITLGGDFQGLKIQSANIVNGKTYEVSVRITGALSKNTGKGTITVRGAVWTGGTDLTTSITVLSNTDPVDKSALSKELTDAQNKLNGAPAWCTQAAKDAMTAAIAVASLASKDGTAQEDVDMALAKLQQAYDDFMSSWTVLTTSTPAVHVNSVLSQTLKISIFGLGSFTPNITKDMLMLAGDFLGLQIASVAIEADTCTLDVTLTGALAKKTGTGSIAVGDTAWSGNKLMSVSFTVIDGNIYGDVDDNGVFDRADYTMLKQYILGFQPIPTTQGLAMADVNGDGRITSADYAFMKKKLNNSAYKFPVENK